METISSINTKTIKRLMSVSNSIYNRYLVLSRLEEHNRTNTQKYSSVISDISLAEEIENKLYCQLDYSNISALLNYIAMGFEDIDFVDDFNAVITGEDLISVIRRIVNRISFSALVQESIYGIGDNLYFADLGPYKEAFSKVRMGKTLESDTINRFIYYLNEEAQKEENKKFKKKLLEAKYHILFFNKNIIDDRDSIFDDRERLIITAQQVGNRYGLTKEDINNECNRYNKQRFLKQKSALSVIGDNKYENDDTKLKSILISCLLKAILVGFNQDTRKDLLIQILEERNTKYYKNFYYNSNISSSIIDNCFLEAENDSKKLVIK